MLATNLPSFETPYGWHGAGCVGMLALLGLWGLTRVRSHVAGTTLRAAWYWATLSLTAQSLAMLVSVLGPPGPWNMPLGYAAAIASFGPLVAVLGAKRPQDRAWQWIVLTLLIVLALPSGEFLLLRRGIPFTLHAARAWFITVLAAIGLCNYLPTRYWLAATCFLAAQFFQLAAYLPWLSWPWPVIQAWLGLVLSICVPIAACVSPRPKVVPSWDRLWIDFRDTFGVVWGLRVMERFNAAMRASDSPVQLTWHGLCVTPSDQANGSPLHEPETLAAVARNLKPLLRRFVSDAWIASRLGEPPDAVVECAEKPPG